MSDPPESIEAGDGFRFFSEVSRICSPEEMLPVPPGERVSLVATVPRYGLLVIAHGGFLQVYNSQALSCSPGNTSPLSSVWCGGRISHVSRTCDSLNLVVAAIWPDNTPHLLFFDIRTMTQEGSSPAPYLQCSGSSTVGSRLTCLAVSPTDPGCVALCTSSGDLTLLSVSDNSVSYNTKKGIGAGAIGWSAKGKQVCIGLSNGTLALFKPDLTPVREIAAPPLGSPCPVTAVVWFTNTEFFVAYQQDNFPSLVYVSGPKGKEPQFVFYDDVCYSSSDSDGPHYYHITYIAEWNQVFVLSSRGVEMATLVKSPAGWSQMFLDEGNRAEMHFVNVTQETYPLGMALDTASGRKFAIKAEEASEGPFPVFYSLSTGGELNIFHACNKLPDKPDLCSANPVEKLPGAIGVRTAQQYGMSMTIPAQSTAAPQAAAAAVSSASAAVGTTAAAVSLPSMFGGGSLPAASGGGSLFGGSAAAPSTSAAGTGGSFLASSLQAPTSSLFGKRPQGAADGTMAGGSLFSSGSSLFGGAKTPLSGSMFGGAAGSAAPSVSSTTTTTSAPPAFSFSGPATTSAAGSLFGGSSTTSSMFGVAAAAAPTTGSSSLFSSQAGTAPPPFKPESGNLAAPATSAAPAAAGASAGFAFNFSSPASASQVTAGASSGSVLLSSLTSGTKPISKSDSNVTVPTTPKPFTSGGGVVGSITSGTAMAASNKGPPSEGCQSPLLPRSGAESARQTPVRDPPVAGRTAQQNKALMAQINEEHELFDRELREHFSISEQCEYKGGWEATTSSLQDALQEMEMALARQQQQSVSDGVAELHAQVLEFYSSYEDAKALCNRIKDPSHAYLAEWRGLDRCSERRLQELRAKLHYIQSEMSYANATLDTIASTALNKANNRRNRRQQRGGGGQSPAVAGNTEDVYKTVLLTHNVRVACEKQLDQLSSRMKGLSLWTGQAGSAPSRSGKYGISNESLLVGDDSRDALNVSSGGGCLTPSKQDKLWHLLQQRKTTPLRKSGRSAYNPCSDAAALPAASRQLAAAAAAGAAASTHMSPHTPLSVPPSTPPQRSLNTPDRSLLSMSTFGPTKFSTPTEPSPSTSAAKFGLRGQLGMSSVQAKPTLNLDSAAPSSDTKFAFTAASDDRTTAGLPAVSTAAFQMSSAAPSYPGVPLKTEANPLDFGASRTGVLTPKYEDITPPGTPDIPHDVTTEEQVEPAKAGSTNPLTALTSLVGKVPPISAASVAPAQGFFSSGGQTSLFGATSSTTSTVVSQESSSGVTASKPFTGFTSSASATTTPAMFGAGSNSAFTKATGTLSMPFAPSASASSNNTTPPTLTGFGLGSSSGGFLSAAAAATTTTVTTSTAVAASASGVSTSTGTFLSTSGGSMFTAPASSSSGAMFSSLPKPTAGFATGGSLFGGTSSATSLFSTTSGASSQSPLFGGSSGLFGAPSSTIKSESQETAVSSAANSDIAPSLTTPLTPTTPTTQAAQSTAVGSTAETMNSSVGLLASVASANPSSSASKSLFAVSSAAAVRSSNQVLLGALAQNSSISITPVASTLTPVVSNDTPSSLPSYGQATSAAAIVTSSLRIPSSSGAVGSLFGGQTTITVTSPPSTSAGSMFGATGGGSLFGALTAATSAPPAFGTSTVAPTTTTNSTSTSVFGSPATSTTTSLFGGAAPKSSLFGAPPSSSGGSLFAASSNTSTTSSVFGAPATTSTSIFGTPTSSGGSVFGATASSGGTTSVFGSSTGSVFGGAAAATSSSSSVFGQSSSTTGGGSLFGGGSAAFAAKPATSGGSLFGGSSGSSVFGASTAAPAGSSMFGGTAAPAGSSVFGGTSAAPGGSSVFGGTSSASAGSSVFGGSTATTTVSSVFGGSSGGGASVFGASDKSSTGSMFGGASSGTAGGSGSVFGGSGSFGSSAAAPSVFGSSSGFGSSGGSTGGGESSLFGSGSSMFGGLGGKPSNTSNKNVFGVSSGAVKPQTDLFGGSGAAAPAPSVFGGSAASPARPSQAFGSAATFGSPPKFGSSPAFGGSPAFGSAVPAGTSTFGSSSVFGGSGAAAVGSFGGASSAGAGASSGFSSFANSPGTATFGGLAANSGSAGASAGFGAPGSGGAPAFTPSASGASSFSSWR